MKEKRTLRSVRKILIDFFRKNRRMPSYAEIIALLGVRSKSVVHFWVEKLVAADLLARDEKGRLSLIQRPFAVPLLGSVRAGFPSPEEEALCDILSMDEYLIARPEASFLLQVSGDSMNGAGIVEGDLVIVERGARAQGGRYRDRRGRRGMDHEALPSGGKNGGPGGGQSEVSPDSSAGGAQARGGRHRGDPEVSLTTALSA